MRVDFVRLPYPHGKMQVYLPTDLHLQASRLRMAGYETRVIDANMLRGESLREVTALADVIAVGLFGAPYVPGAQRVVADALADGKQVIVGGRVAEALEPHEFRLLFGEARQIRANADLESLTTALLPVRLTSAVSSLHTIPDAQLEAYLRAEFAVYTAQGCKHGCSFCGAVKRVPEEYRTQPGLAAELAFLTSAARRFGIPNLSVYLTNLDLFQNPLGLDNTLRQFAASSRASGVRFTLRGLSRVDSFLRALEHRPDDLMQSIRDAGLSTIGFGIDGTDESIWKAQHKGWRADDRSQLLQTEEAYALCNDLHITPETLTVFGFAEDTPETLDKDLAMAVHWARSFRAVSRPYLAKPFIPGNDGWNDPAWRASKQRCFSQPDLFMNLDFAAFASNLTHPDARHRDLVNDHFDRACSELDALGLNATYPLQPYVDGPDATFVNQIIAAENAAVPFDK